MTEPQNLAGGRNQPVEAAAEAGSSRAMSTRMAERMAQSRGARAPEPKGKGLAMIGLVVVVLIGVVDLLLNESGASRGVREAVEKRTASELMDPDQVQPPEAGDTGAMNPKATNPNATDRMPPANGNQPAPGTAEAATRGEIRPTPSSDESGARASGTIRVDASAMMAMLKRIPEDFSEETKSRLKNDLMALADLDGGIALAAYAALRDLPRVVRLADDDERDRVRSFLLQEVLRVARNIRYRREAFEVARWLQEGAADEDAAVLLEFMLLAQQRAFSDNKSAPAALMFVKSQQNSGGAPMHAVLRDIVLDVSRPIHIRRLAAECLPDAALDAKLVEFAKAPSTHPELRAALSR